MKKTHADVFMEAVRFVLLGVMDQNHNAGDNRSDNFDSACSFFVPAVGMLSYLSMEYPDWNLPTNMQTMLSYFLHSTKQIKNQIPDKVLCEMKEDDAILFEGGPILDNIGDTYFVTDDGNDFFSQRVIKDVFYSAGNNAREYRSQILFERMSCGTQDKYIRCRSFLENPLNLFFPTDVVFMTEEQDALVKEEPEILGLAYEMIFLAHNEIATCPICGAPMINRGNGNYICVSSDTCRKKRQTKIARMVRTDCSTMYVLRPEVIRDIYYPGILERKVEAVLIAEGFNYRWWPEMDTADFGVEMDDGTEIFLDAKCVKNAYYLLFDNGVKHMTNGKNKFLIYVVEKQNSNMLERLNREFEARGLKAKCVNLNNLSDLLKGERNHDIR